MSRVNRQTITAFFRKIFYSLPFGIPTGFNFGALLERLRDVGYCCTQAQKDLKGGKCTAWFRPTTLA